MILRLEQMLGVVLLALGLGALLHYYARWHGDDTLVWMGPVVTGMLALAWLVPSWRAYAYYNDIGLIAVNRQLAFTMLRRAQPGAVIQVGGRFYYRSRGRKNRRTLWPRLWVFQLDHIAAMERRERRWVDALVLWPVPFLGGMRHSRSVQRCVEYLGDGEYRLHIQPVAKRDWVRLHDMSYTELLALCRDAERALQDMKSFRAEDDVIGSSRHFKPVWWRGV